MEWSDDDPEGRRSVVPRSEQCFPALGRNVENLGSWRPLRWRPFPYAYRNRRWRNARVPPTHTICTPGGNPYASGINVNTNNTPINLTLQPGVNVTIPAGSPGVNAVNAANTTGTTATSAPVTITANGVTILNNNNPTGNNQTGLRIQSSGNANITATNTTINVSGTASDWAYIAIVLDGGAPHNASVNLTQARVVTSSGIEAGAIQADNRGNGNATVVASGAITVTPNAGLGTTQYGLLAHAGDPRTMQGPAMRP